MDSGITGSSSQVKALNVTIVDLRDCQHARWRPSARRASSFCRRAIAFALAIASCLVSGNAQGQVLNEYEAKAGYLFNFVKFVEWPHSAFPDDASPLVVGVVGNDKTSAEIDTINGKIANGRRLVVKRFADFKALTSCHIVFVLSSEKERIRQTLAAAGSALTVGEIDGFAHRGGIINFTFSGNKLQLEINQASADRAGLKISAKLLSLARVIRK